jgi:ketosteroid isomerase-like protein
MKGAVFVLIVLTTTSSFAQSKVDQEIQAAEKAWAEAYQSCDQSTMAKLLSDDLTLIVHVNGATMDKQGFMKGVAACSMAKVVNIPTRIRVYGNTAAVEGKSTYTIKNTAAPISVIYTRVWVRTKGQWQIVNHQSTGLPAPKE